MVHPGSGSVGDGRPLDRMGASGQKEVAGDDTQLASPHQRTFHPGRPQNRTVFHGEEGGIGRSDGAKTATPIYMPEAAQR